MKTIIKIAFFLLISCCCLNAKVGDIVKRDYEDGDFKLVFNDTAAGVCYDKSDYKVVEIAANLLSQDIESVTGIRPSVYADLKQAGGRVVIIGTIGHNEYIDQLIREGRIDACGVDGQWETYGLQAVDKPFENITSALVIFGSDRRGTAYGVFELSKQIGVSPWYWWADVPIQKQKTLVIKKGFYCDGPPSVKYRGIFINDEDWGLKPWASKTFDPQLGDIGPKTYKKVFELLLRLKANHCWPAMHECTKPFNYYPNNKKVADDYAIVMGSSHCEPLLFNNATEWDAKKMGEWRYDINKENIYKVLDKRVSENGKFENVYTVGLRGMHDREMRGNLKLEQRIGLLEKVFADERKILTNHINKKITDIPQVFIPYKEVMTLYNNGLKVPEDVTLMWVDDNYGYIRRLSDPLEIQRPGGAGVYYHISYLGPPHEYLWLCTTPPALIWEEMTKAYNFNARQVWIVNVGDIKPCEYGTNFFLDLAWDINSVNQSNIQSHLTGWLASAFGQENSQELTAIMKEFYNLCFERKPEFMSFGAEFGFSNDLTARWEDTEYSFVNYREAERRLQRFESISNRAGALYDKMPENLKPAYFELVYYPVAAANYMNRKILLAQENRWFADQQRNSTNICAGQVQHYFEKINELTQQYDTLLNGKWKYMVQVNQNSHSVYYRMPPVKTIEIPQRAQMGVFTESSTPNQGIDVANALPCFNPVYDQNYFIEIYNKGKTPFNWRASANQRWIKLSKSSGKVDIQERIFVSINWLAVGKQEVLNGKIEIQGAGGKKTIYVNCFNPAVKKDQLKGMFVENNGVISISAADFTRKTEPGFMTWNVIDGLGLTGKSVISLPVTAEPNYSFDPNLPHLEYDIYTFNSGVVEIQSFVLPVFPISSFRNAQYAVSIDDGRPQSIEISVPEYSAQWKENVRRNAAKNITRHYINKPGKHILKLWMADTGMAFDKIIVDLGGLKMSYIGPQETYVQ
ncbi:MAG: glycosyl hydrolase 115 family protein [Sedimentisphaerales bacterium]